MAPPPLPPGPIIILENGAHTIKCGVLPSSSASTTSSSSTTTGTYNVGDSDNPRIIPNACVRPRTSAASMLGANTGTGTGAGKGAGSRWLVGHEISDALARDALDYAGMQYRLPFEKGFLTDWDAQKAIWDGLFAVDPSSSSSSVSSISNATTATKTGPLLPRGIDTTGATLLVTEPYFNLPAMQDTYDQIVFEEYEFAACWRGVPAALVPHGTLFADGSGSGASPHQPHNQKQKPQCTLIVDAGFSYTHVVPMVDGRVVWQAVKRIDAGGKLLTNVLKEQLSYRQWNMMAETFIVQEVMEACCFVAAADAGRRGVKDVLEGSGCEGNGYEGAMDFRACMERCRADPSGHTNPIVQEYVLPDLAAGRKGHVRVRAGQQQSSNERADTREKGREEQVLVMGVERFSVPEVLFRPDDIGMPQSGLAPTIAHSLASLPAPLRPFAGMFWAHVGLVGGCTKFPGFRARLEQELRALAPVGCAVRVWGGGSSSGDGDRNEASNDDPITTTYRAARSFAASSTSSTSPTHSDYPSFAQQTLSRAEYLEAGGGSAAARRRFVSADWLGAPEENWRARVDEAFAAGEDDEVEDPSEDHDLDDWDVDMDMDGLNVPDRRGARARAGYSSSARARVEGGRQEDEEEAGAQDADTRAAREKEERRKAARRKRDAERKKRLMAEAGAAGTSAGAQGTAEAAGTVTVSKARGGAMRGKQKDKEKEAEAVSAAGAGAGKAKAKAKASAATPVPTAPPRVRSTRAGAAEVQTEVLQEPPPAASTQGLANIGETAENADADVQMDEA